MRAMFHLATRQLDMSRVRRGRVLIAAFYLIPFFCAELAAHKNISLMQRFRLRPKRALFCLLGPK